jgi:hypothetical protein
MMINKCPDHAHSWVTAFTNLTSVHIYKVTRISDHDFLYRLTLDQLLLNSTFAAEQHDLWFKNHTGNIIK